MNFKKILKTKELCSTFRLKLVKKVSERKLTLARISGARKKKKKTKKCSTTSTKRCSSFTKKLRTY